MFTSKQIFKFLYNHKKVMISWVKNRSFDYNQTKKIDDICSENKQQRHEL